MLNYGTAAQELFGYHTGDLANAILPETERQIGSMDLTALASYQSVQTGNMPDGISYYGSSLVLRSGTLIRHYFTKAGDVELSDITFTLNGNAVTPVSVGSNMFYIEIPAVHSEHYTDEYIGSRREWSDNIWCFKLCVYGVVGSDIWKHTGTGYESYGYISADSTDLSCQMTHACSEYKRGQRTDKIKRIKKQK